ncbi:FAD/NAD(P)-binding protein [Haloferula sp. BvORR071]|uniref:FAD/NAD(P)-binding protein n=1 Tax=Haloferula sp. BvORR071 TaxID=1396141 RepID=UPI002240F5D2|nr:FAD/NAD(P)-binding protein [Haloferula sp. BvORR071]
MPLAFASPDCVGAGIAKLAAEVAEALDKSSGSAEWAEGDIRTALQRALTDDDLILGELPAAPMATYRQELLHVDPAGRFSIAALIWLPGHRTPVHDHRCWCCFGVWRGREVETLWMRDARGRLVAEKSGVCYRGEVEFLHPPGDIHQVSNDDMTPTVSIHIYGADLIKAGSSIQRCYDVDAAAHNEAGLRTFAVVGGGFSGTMTAVHLLRECSPDARVVLFEAAPEVGRGVAYGTRCLTHLLNVPAGSMSAFPDAPGHFHEWCSRKGRSIAASDFAPRTWYGEYLGDVLKDAALYSRAKLEVRTEQVECIDGRDGDFQVLSSNGGALQAEAVVLAIGTPPGREHFPAGQEWPAMADPWNADALQEVDPAHEVLIVGTGLTCMDVLAELAARGHRGKIVAISRRGLLPACHVPHGGAGAPAFDAQGFREQLAQEPMKISRLCRRVRQAIAEASAAGMDWRDVINALRPVTTSIWAALPGRERRRFKRHLKPYWETVRHRIAPAVMAAADSLREAGILEQYRGGIARLERLPSGRYAAEWTHQQGSGRGEFDRVINATGFTARLAGSNSPLLDNLLGKGWIREDEMGLGVDTSSDFRLVEEDGGVVSGIYYVGPMLRARYWECTAVPELRMRAAETAASVLKHATKVQKPLPPSRTPEVAYQTEVAYQI